MSRVQMKDLLEAGVHFGHLTRRWNPKMKPYIFGERNGIYIVDLHQTLAGVETACDFIEKVVTNGGSVLFVGTKKQAQEAMAEAARQCGMYHVTHRWLGGMLTNFQTIRESITRLKALKEMDRSGALDRRPKKEAAGMRDDRDKLDRVLGGIEDMPGMPSVLFIIDLKEEHIAVQEARKLGIPIVAVVDTNCDPEVVDYVIPGNDDAIRAIKLIANTISETVIGACLQRDKALSEGQVRANAVDMVRRHRENVDARLRPEAQAAATAEPEAPTEAEVEAQAVAALAEADDLGFVAAEETPLETAAPTAEVPAIVAAPAVEPADAVVPAEPVALAEPTAEAGALEAPVAPAADEATATE